MWYTGRVDGAVSFTDPPSGSVIANFEGTENVTTITCNVTNQEFQISTWWTVSNFRGFYGLQLITDDFDPELFEISGDPVPGSSPEFTFRNYLGLRLFRLDLDNVTVFCGTGAEPRQANFSLRIYRKCVLGQCMVYTIATES